MRRIHRLLVPLVALLFFTLGCGTESGQSHDVDIEDLLFPTAQENVNNYNLIEEAVKTCMLEEGFDYQVRTWPIEAAEYKLFPRLDLLTTAQASERGFGFAVEKVSFSDSNSAVAAEMGEREQQAWFEAYLQCSPAADDEINGEYNEGIFALRAEYDDLVAEFASDPAVVALEGLWASCMRDKGFDNTPSSFAEFAQQYLDAYNRLASGGPAAPAFDARLEELFDEERRAAVAAVDCADPVRDDYTELWAAHQRDFVENAAIPEIPQ